MKTVVITWILFVSLISITAQLTTEDYLKNGRIYFDNGLYEKSFMTFDTAATLALKASHMHNYVLALTGKGIARRYSFAPKYREARNYFGQAQLLAQTIESFPKNDLANIYYHLATTERELINYTDAYDFGLLALNYAEEVNDISIIAKCNHAIANILNDEEKFTEAFIYFEKAITLRKSFRIRDDDILITYYNNLANTYRNSGDYKKSNDYLDLVMDINSKWTYPDPNTDAVVSRIKALNFIALKDTLAVTKIYQELLEDVNKKDFKDKTLKFQYFWHLGRIQAFMGNLDTAIYYFHKSLSAGIYDFDSDDISESPVLNDSKLEDQLFAQDYIYDVLDDKGSSLTQLYRNRADTTLLLIAQQTYDAVDQIMLRQRFQMDDSPSLHLAKHAQFIYGHALDNLYELYHKNPNDGILNQVFKFIERNKQIELLKNKLTNQQLEANFQSGSEVRDLAYAIELRRKELLVSQAHERRDTSLKGLLEELVDLHISKKVARDSLHYNKIGLEFRDIELSELRSQLGSDRVLLTYFWGEESIFALGISEKSSIFRRIDTASVITYINEFIRAFSSPRKLSDFSQFNSYIESAASTYSKLVSPLVTPLDETGMIHDLIIIPDGIMNSLSFAALLKSDNRDKKVNYSNLDYLIKSYNLGYSFSVANMLTDQKIHVRGSSMLSFSDHTLIGSGREVEEISSIWKGPITSYTDTSSSEASFKNESKNYDIIHLSCHATAGTNEDESFLVFNSGTSSNEDGRLYNYEIYPLQLNARLVTLSACETGLGRDKFGDGVYSLARGFNYAGCPSIIMSLWKIDDMQTSLFMPKFYNEFMSGSPVSHSLRNAQLDFLEKADRFQSHPYNWAGFVVIGDGDQIMDDFISGKENIIVVILLALTIVSFVLWLKKRASPV